MNKKAINKKYLLMIMTTFYMLGVMGTRPLVSLLSHNLGAPPVEIGIITGIFALLPFFFAIQIGKYIDIHGYKRIIFFSSFFCFMGLILPIIIPDIMGIYFSQIITGVSYTTFVVAGQTMAGVDVQEESKESNVMRFSIGVALGSFIGPLFGGIFAEKWGYHSAFLMLGMGCLITMFISLIIVEIKGPIANENTKPKLNATYLLLKEKKLRKIILIGILVLFGKDMYTAFFPLLGLELALTNSMIGIIISINAAAGILVRWALPYFLKNYAKEKVIIGSILLSGICMITIPSFENWSILTITSFILGAGLGIGQPLSISATIQYLPKQRVGEGLGLRLSANRLTQLLAPLLIGGMAEIISVKGVFYIVGLSLCIGINKIRGLTINVNRIDEKSK